MIVKKPYILLELLIAFALVSSATLPFFRYPFQHMKREISSLFTLELERIAQNKLAQLHEELFKKNIPTKLLFDEEKQKNPIEIHTVTIKLAPNIARQFEEKVYVTSLKRKKIKDQKTATLVQFKVQYRKPNDSKIILEATSEAIAQKKS